MNLEWIISTWEKVDRYNFSLFLFYNVLVILYLNFISLYFDFIFSTLSPTCHQYLNNPTTCWIWYWIGVVFFSTTSVCINKTLERALLSNEQCNILAHDEAMGHSSEKWLCISKRWIFVEDILPISLFLTVLCQKLHLMEIA